MAEHVVSIVVALLGLFGTIAGLVFAHRQTMHKASVEQSRSFRKSRQKAYKGIWEQVEKLNVEGRLEELAKEEHSQRIAEINAFMMTSNVYIDEPDRSLVNSYLRAARAFHEAVRACDFANDNLALGDTGEIPKEVLEQSMAIRDTQKEALALRSRLLTKIRSVVSGAAA